MKKNSKGLWIVICCLLGPVKWGARTEWTRVASPSSALPSLPSARWHTEFVLAGNWVYKDWTDIVWWAVSLRVRGDKGSFGGGMGTVWTRVFGEWACQGHRRRYTKPECIFGDKGTSLHTLNKLCWPARRPCPFCCSIWLSLDPSMVQCNRYALQSYLSTAQWLYKHGRKTLLESLKSSTGSFKPLPHTSGWDLMLCIKKRNS